MSQFFNRSLHEVMPYYKAEVMHFQKITSDEEYKRRVLEGDNSIYLPQPNAKFRPSMYCSCFGSGLPRATG